MTYDAGIACCAEYGKMKRELDRLLIIEEKLRQLTAYLQYDAEQNPTRNSIGPCAEMFLDEPAFIQAIAALNRIGF